MFIFCKVRVADPEFDDDWCEGTEVPKSVFKPTGLRMWYDEDPSDTHSSNQSLNSRILDEVFIRCIECAWVSWSVSGSPSTPEPHRSGIE